jgi:general secretion pathway protein G
MLRLIPSRRPVSFAWRAAHRGMTMLEIMIVIAILGLVMGLVVVPKVMEKFDDSKLKIAKLAVDKFAFEAYPQWALATKKQCPNNLVELAQHMGKSEADTKDPWDQPYKMLCGQTLPQGVSGGIGIVSMGPDQKEGTEDDIKSW